MSKNEIGSFPILNLLLGEENAEFPDAKYVNVENLEELTHTHTHPPPSPTLTATSQRMRLPTAAQAVHLTMIFKVWLIKFQAMLAFKSSLLSSIMMSHGTAIFKNKENH